MYFKFMRLILFFDLPTLTNKNLKDYRNFIKNIKRNGFYMYQQSVYVKLCLNDNVAETTIKFLNEIKPDNGLISLLKLSENEFTKMINLVGESKSDVINNFERITKL